MPDSELDKIELEGERTGVIWMFLTLVVCFVLTWAIPVLLPNYGKHGAAHESH